MSDLAKAVGNRIKFIRKKKNISIEELADGIYRGKSTVYKYENGSIPIDISTLGDIADYLEVPVTILCDVDNQKERNEKMPLLPLGNSNKRYLYMYTDHRLVKSLMMISYHKQKNKIKVTLYFDVNSFDRYEKCKNMYVGDMVTYDFVSYFRLQNNLSISEHLNGCVLNPLTQEKETTGMLFGLMDFPLQPVAYKIILSSEQIEEKNLKLRLVLSQNEIDHIKKTNMFLGE